MTNVRRAQDLLESVSDPGSFIPQDQPDGVPDPLGWSVPVPYTEKVKQAREQTGMVSAVAWGPAAINGNKVVLIAGEFAFLGASLGVMEAAAIVRAMETAGRDGAPLVWFACGGGLRLQEGSHALLGISRILAARQLLSRQGIPFITVATHPLMAGTTVCACQADVTLGFCEAIFGFAGPRVVRTHEKFPLPPNFQTTEYALANGHLDLLVDDDDLTGTLARLLDILGERKQAVPVPAELTDRTEAFEARAPWACVQAARTDKPLVREVIAQVADDFFELHGDRVHADDPAVLGGLASIGGVTVMFLGHDSGKPGDAIAGIRHNFNSAHPSGHRKALRLVRLAERLGIPIITLVDTPGAYPDVRAEEEGQAGVLGELLTAMLEVRVPTIALLLGEGCGAGALPFLTADRLIMTDCAWLCSIPPEGAAHIVWGDVAKAPEAAEALHLTPGDMLEAGAVDQVLPVSSRDGDFPDLLRTAILRGLHEIGPCSSPDLQRRTRMP